MRRRRRGLQSGVYRRPRCAGMFERRTPCALAISSAANRALPSRRLPEYSVAEMSCKPILDDTQNCGSLNQICPNPSSGHGQVICANGACALQCETVSLGRP